MRQTQVYHSTVRNEQEEIRAKNKQLLFDTLAAPEWKILEILNVYEATPSELRQLFNKAARLGYAKLVTFLIEERNVDPSYNNSFVLGIAVENNHPNVAHILLNDSRVLYQDPNNQAIVTACIKGYVECVILLLGDGRVHPETYNNMAALLVNRKINELIGYAFKMIGFQPAIAGTSSSELSPGTLIQKLDVSKETRETKILLERYIAIQSLLLSDKRVIETLDERTRKLYATYIGG